MRWIASKGLLIGFSQLFMLLLIWVMTIAYGPSFILLFLKICQESIATRFSSAKNFYSIQIILSDNDAVICIDIFFFLIYSITSFF